MIQQITAGQLAKIYYPCPIAQASKYIDHLNASMLAVEINTIERAAAFLAQVGHESGRLQFVREIWNPDRCPWQARYEGRADLGNIAPGDGSKFRGRGLIHVTGRANYQACGIALGLPLTDHPELLEQPEYAASSDPGKRPGDAPIFFASKYTQMLVDIIIKYTRVLISLFYLPR